MIIQCTLLTCHKGVDLHAETAVRVMRDRLEGGDRLVSLCRAEAHTFWRESEEPATESVSRLLGIGRFFNPNKHHYAHFELPGAAGSWSDHPEECRGASLPAGWPGNSIDTDLPGSEDDLFDRLLGGPPAPDQVAVDVLAFPLGEVATPLSGVLWRLVLADAGSGAPNAETVARELIESRGARKGLLVNPHMQGWLVARRGATA